MSSVRTSGKRRASRVAVKSQVLDTELVELRREQIVAAAVELFSKQGYYKTTILEIARKAGISVGLIYQYARTKEDVLFLTLMSVLDSYKREIPSADDRDPPLASLWKALNAYVRVIDRRRSAAVLAYRSTKSLPTAQRRMIMHLEIETNELLAERVEACVAAGVFRKIDVDLTVYQLVMHAHAWALKHWRLKEITTLDRYIRAGFDAVVRTCATAEGLATYERFGRKAG